MMYAGNVIRYLLKVGIVIGLTACGAANNSNEVKVKTDMVAEEQTPVGGDAASLLTQPQQVEQAKLDLAKRLEIDIQEIELTRASEVSWRSGALGCPKPDMQYTEALVPGTLIVLKANHQHYRYHAKRYAVPFYCPNEQAEPPSAAASDI